MSVRETDSQKKYQVIVADNYHYQDESANYTHGYFDTLEEAIAACRMIVDRYLAEALQPGMTSTDLYTQYQMFGDDPYIIGGNEPGVPFSAWDYAAQRSTELCG